MPAYDFTDTTVFVTGAARGQGRSHAVMFAEHGADVVVTDICDEISTAQYALGTSEELHETARRVENTGQTALPIDVDVRDESAVERAVDRAVAHFGRIDVLVNNAGIWNVTSSLEIDEQTWDDIVEVNLKGVWLCSKHVGQHMIERGGPGKIVNTASIGGLVATTGSAHYTAAKHGVVGITKALALELAEYDITVNAVCPTGTETPMIENIVSEMGEQALASVSDIAGEMNVIDGELLPPQAISEAILWLASDASQYVTGVALPVDAGMTAK